MGGCAGKNKSNSDESTSNSTKKPKSRTKDDNLQSSSASSSPKNLPSSNNVTVNNDNKNRIPNKEENGISPDTQILIKEQDAINNIIRQTFPTRVISVSNSELEIELANLIYGHPEKDYAETPHVAPTFKSTEV